MKRSWSQLAWPLAILAFCAWQAADLVVAWRHSPFDRLGWVAFLIWLAPVALERVRDLGSREPALSLLLAALVLAFAGRLLDINAPRALALACAIVAFVAPAGPRWLWAIAAVAWMPVMGWVLRDLPPVAVGFLRCLVASGGLAAWFYRPVRLQPA